MIRTDSTERTLAVTASGTHNDIKPSASTITIGAWRHTNTGYLGGDQFGSMVWIGTTAVAANGTSTDPGNDTGNPTSLATLMAGSGEGYSSSFSSSSSGSIPRQRR